MPPISPSARLERVLPGWSSGSAPVYALCPSKSQLPLKTRVLLDALHARVSGGDGLETAWMRRSVSGHFTDSRREASRLCSAVIDGSEAMLIRAATREYRTWSMDSRRWAEFTPRAGDIVIATPPKCGTTWTQQIVASLIFRDPTPRSLPEVSPWIDLRLGDPVEKTYVRLEAQTHRRFIKTHLPIDGLPLHDDVLYILVARDGRDVALSSHNHFGANLAATVAQFDRIGLEDPVIGRHYPRLPEDPAEFFQLWLTTPAVPGQSDGLTNPSFFDLVAGYWAERRRANVLLVHYADLTIDLEGEMRRIADYLGIEVEEELWPSLVDGARFETMKAAGDVLMPRVSAMLSGGAQRFFNKGGTGGWRAVLGDAELELYEAKVREKFSPDLAAWVEGGRAKAGDPKVSPD